MIALTYLASLLVLYGLDVIEGRMLAVLFVGGTVIAAVGFVDDRIDLDRRLRLGAHAALAVWILLWVGGAPSVEIGGAPLDLGPAGDVFALLAVTWFINLYNFMDGVDGMAASGTIFFSVAAGALLLLAGERTDLSAAFGYLAAATLGFLPLNLPKARLFMGDTGSGFLGYSVAALAVVTMSQGAMSAWVWIILLGYFLSDTGVTLVLRLVLHGRRFYRTHRDHAYQNLARIWGSHGRITALVTAVHLVWLFPLALIATLEPRLGPALAVLANLPLIAFALRFGPLNERWAARRRRGESTPDDSDREPA